MHVAYELNVAWLCTLLAGSTAAENWHNLQEWFGGEVAGTSPAIRTASAGSSAHCITAAGGRAAPAASSPGYPSAAISGYI